MSFRQASKTDYIDGVLVPEGTLFYIPVRLVYFNPLFLSLLHFSHLHFFNLNPSLYLLCAF